MSTYWGLHCKPCDSHTGAGKNHGEVVLSDFARMSLLLRQLWKMDSQGYLELDILGHFEMETGYDGTFIGWLIEHAGHTMELYNEYGEYEPLRPERICEL